MNKNTLKKIISYLLVGSFMIQQAGQAGYQVLARNEIKAEGSDKSEQSSALLKSPDEHSGDSYENIVTEAEQKEDDSSDPIVYDNESQNVAAEGDYVRSGEEIIISGDEELPETAEGSVVISGDYTFCHDVTINGDLTVKNYDCLDLNGYTVTVKGNCVFGRGNQVFINKGSLICEGDCSTDAMLYMNEADDLVEVKGNLKINKKGQMTAGTIIVSGNIDVNAGDFRPSGSHLFVLNGDRKQIVSFSYSFSGFNNVEYANTSSDGIVYESNGQIFGEIRNTDNCKVEYFENGKIGSVLEEDTVIDGEYLLVTGVLDLNGHNLTVRGDLIQAGGEVNINGGKLTVEGDYRIQNRNKNQNGDVIYENSAGKLIMINEKDEVNISGDFITGSLLSHKDLLSAGVMKTGGNFVQLSGSNSESFCGSGTHTVKFTGEKEHDISLRSTDSGFGVLDISGETVKLSTSEVTVKTLLKSENGKISGEMLRIAANAELPETVNGNIWVYVSKNRELHNNLTVNGDLKLYGGRSDYTLDLNGYSLSVNGNCILHYVTVGMNESSFICSGNITSDSGNINMNSSSLSCSGDVSGYIYMTSSTLKCDGNCSVKINRIDGEDSLLETEGDLTITSSQNITAGKIKTAGDLNISGSFSPSGTSTVIFDGNRLQTVKSSNNSVSFNNIEYANTGSEGVRYESPCHINGEIINTTDCKVEYYGGGNIGSRLEKDTVIEGEYLLSTGELDLNGHRLTVKGDLIQSGGEINVNGGTLEIEGDYRIQRRTENENGDTIYGKSAGKLIMDNEEDSILINGDFIINSSSSNLLTAGTMKTGGNFVQIIGSSLIENDVTIKGDLVIQNGGKTDVKNGTLKIEGNVISSGDINVSYGEIICGGNAINDAKNFSLAVCKDGSFICNGDFSGVLYAEENGYFRCDGCCEINIYIMMSDFIMEANGDLILNNSANIGGGTIKAAGNVTITEKFKPSGNHTFILDGNALQKIYLSDSDYSKSFKNVEYANTGSEGIVFESECPITGEIKNTTGCKVKYFGGGNEGEKLEKDTVIEGEYILSGGVLDLNGHKLTIKGDLLHAGGEIKVNGGELNIEGNYLIQSRKTNDKNQFEYGLSSGILNMTNESDIVNIGGNFVTNSSVSHVGRLTAGKMNVAGDFTLLSSENKNNFVASGSHTVKFTGNKQHNILFQSPGGYFGTLDISDEEAVLKSANVKVVNELICENGKMSVYPVIITGKVKMSDTVNGDVKIQGDCALTGDTVINGSLLFNSNGLSCLDLNGYTLTVTQECNLPSYVSLFNWYDYSYLKFNKGTLICEGKVFINAHFTMSHEEDLLDVRGDLIIGSANNLSAGTIKAKGNLDLGNSSFVSSGNHTVVFEGDRKQNITAGDKPPVFNNVEFSNTSDEGVEFKTPCTINGEVEFTSGKNNVILYGGGRFGEILTEDITINGDYILGAGTLDLNGHKVIINGDFIQPSGKVKINGGTLEVNGDYRIQNVNIDADDVVYGISSGLLEMTDSRDKVIVNGTFAVDSGLNYEDMITEGELRIRGNMEIKSSSGAHFSTSGKNTIIFDGTECQTINIESYYYSHLANLKFENDSEIIIASDICADGEITDITHKLSGNGYIVIPDIRNINGKEFSRNIRIMSENAEKTTLDSDLSVKNFSGEVIHLNGNNFKADNAEIGMLYPEKGTAEFAGDLTVKYRMDMNDSEDSVYVGNNFVIKSDSCSEWEMSDGVLEVKGDFYQTGKEPVVCKDNHVVILSGRMQSGLKEHIQTVKFLYPGESKFNELHITKPENYYAVFDAENNSFSLETICSKLVKNFSDTTAPSKATGLKVSEITASSAVVSWNASTDNEYVAGYEVYRNGEKICTTSDTVFTDTRLLPEEKYVYSVYAFDRYRNYSEVSEEISVITEKDTTAPDKVQNLRIDSRTGSSVTLSWSPSHDNVEVTEYIIFCDGKEAGRTEGKTQFKVTGLDQDKKYVFSVKAEDKAGNLSEESKTLDGYIHIPVISSITPADKSETGGKTQKVRVYFPDSGNSSGNSVVFEYKDDNDESGEYRLMSQYPSGQCRSSSDMLYAECIWDISGLSGSYTVRATLHDEDNNTAEIKAVYTVDSSAPKLPEDITGSSDNGSAVLVWSPSVSANCEKYLIYKSESENGDYEKISEVSGRNTVRFTDREVKEGQTYFYKVAALSRYGIESSKSNTVSVLVEKDKLPPEVNEVRPDTSRVKGDVSVGVLAEDNTALDKTVLEYRSEDSDKWTIIGEKKFQSGYAEIIWKTSELTDGEYLVRATASDLNGNISEGFIKTYTVDNTGIGKIELISEECTAGSSFISLRWNDVSEPDFGYFEVLMKKTDGSFVSAGTTSTTTGMHIQDLVSDTDYTFKVVGYDNIGNRGIESDEITITTAADKTAPSIRSFSPAPAAFADRIDMSADVVDNIAVKSVSFRYSYDEKTWNELGTAVIEEPSRDAHADYTFDISGLEEGEIFVEAAASDTSGNISAPVVNKFKIDRTAPAKPTDLKADGKSGNVHLTWTVKDNDIRSFIIYRCSDDQDKFSVLTECSTKDYYDLTAEYGKSYFYMIKCADGAGNISEESDTVLVNVSEDTEKPKVLGFNYKDKSVLGISPKMEVVSYDNSRLLKTEVEYKKADTNDTVWTKLDSFNMNSNYESASFVWDTEGFEETSYTLRAVAYDESGNVSDVFESSYTFDLTAPKTPVVELIQGNLAINVSWATEDETGADEDIEYYSVYRMADNESEYSFLGNTVLREITDTSVNAAHRYQYKITAYDKVGNLSSGESAEAIRPADKDEEPPQIVVSDEVTGIAGMEIPFDASESTDNKGIIKYSWKCGEMISSGVRAKLVFKEEGEYTVTLTVEDEAGNKSSKDVKVKVLDRNQYGTLAVKVTDTSGVPIPYAYVCVADDSSESTVKTDSDGIAYITAKLGAHKIAAFKNGYLPEEIRADINTIGTVSNASIVLKSGELVTGNLSVHRMSLEEMAEAGINTADPGNYHTFKFTYELTFEQKPVPTYIEYIYIGDKKESGFTSGSFGDGFGLSPEEGTAPSIKLPGGDIYQIKPVETEEEVPVLAYIRRSESIKFMKDMFTVDLGVINNASPEFKINDCFATLDLPDGLSLAGLEGKTQNLTQSMGTIRGQEKKHVSWYIRGDKAGNYELSADFSGKLMPFNKNVSAKFKTESPFTVDEIGEGLTIYVFPEDAAYPDKPYYVQYALVNEGSKTYYNLSTTFGQFEEPVPDIDIRDLTEYAEPKPDIDTGNVNESIGTPGAVKAAKESEEKSDDSKAIIPYILEKSKPVVVPPISTGQTLKFKAFRPGDVIYGTYKTGLIAPEKDKYGNEVYYRLIKHEITEMTKDMAVKVVISPIPSHVVRFNVKYVPVYNSFGDPVEMTSGAYTESATMISLNSEPLIGMTADYNSMNCSDKGELGYGWNHEYETSLDVNNAGIILLKWNNSNYSTFIDEDYSMYADKDKEHNVIASGGENNEVTDYIPISAGLEGYIIRHEKDGTYTLSFKNGGSNKFDSDGKLTGMINADGKEVLVTYGDKTKTISEKITGSSITLSYDDEGRVVSVKDNAGRTASITYKDGCISSITNVAGNTVHYNYDDKHRILSAYFSDDSEHPYVTNTYDKYNRVVTQDDGLESTPLSEFTYSEDSETGLVTVTATDRNSSEDDKNTVTYISDPLGRVLEYIDQEGDNVIYHYDRRGNLISEESEIGKTSYTYDENGYMLSVTDRVGNKTQMTYDERGNILTVTGPKGTISEYTYNKDNLLETSYEKSKYRKSYVYNDNAQLISETVEGLGTRKFTYSEGRIVTETDMLGNETTYTYDDYGNISSITESDGNKTTMKYDMLGRVISSEDHSGIVTYEYDERGNLVSETDIRGNKTVNTYDGNDNLISSKDAKNTVSYTYDGEGRVLTEVNPEGGVFSYTYDRSGQVTETKNENGEVTKFTYDADGNTISETIVDGKSEYKTEYEYYATGKVKKVTYPDKTSESYEYDSLGMLTSVTDQSGNSTKMEYDVYGNLASQTDAEGNTVKYTYDKYNRVTTVTDANGNVTKYNKYDANGNCLSQELPNGKTVEYVYNSKGLPVEVKVPAASEDDEDISVYFEYDESGRVTKYTDEEGKTLETVYDNSGNVTALKDGDGNIIQENKYDILSNLESTTNALGVESQYVYDGIGNVKTVINNINTSRESKSEFTYDKVGRLLTSVDAADGTSSYTYDQAGNIKTITDPNGGVSRYNYDSMGRITESITPLGSSNKYKYNADGLLEEAENARGQKTTYTYYKNGWIKSFTDEIGTTEYTYDGNGNVLTVTDENGTITRKYDCLNNVTEYTDFRGNTVKYGYDQFGRLVTLEYPGGRIVKYEYYKNGNIKTVTDWNNNQTAYEYDNNNRLVKTSRPDGTVETREYNAAGYLVGTKDCKGDTEICARDYSYDEEGNVVSIKTNGSVDLSSLTDAEMEYNANNQLVKYNGQEVKYDADGNMVYGPLGGKMQSFEYDCRNRLVKAGNTTYSYDAENNRISKTVGEVKTEYVIDTTSVLSRVLVEKTGEKETYYIYGTGLIAQESGKEYYIYHFNNIGSTEAITDINGNVAERFEYGPYGELLSENKTGITFLYNGEYGVATDENGLYYMRQRYYNPEIKRFINQDIVVGDIANSPTLNKYAYAHGNPISLADPFGLSPLFNWKRYGHNILSLAGMIPGVGWVFDGANAIWYMKEGNYEEAFRSFISALPGAGEAVAAGSKALKLGCKGQKIANYIAAGTKIFSGVGTFGYYGYKKFVKGEKLSAWDYLDMAGGAANISNGYKGFKTTSATSFCFVAGTMVRTEDGLVPIEDIKKGDKVLSEDELTGEVQIKEVKETFINESDELVHIFANGDEIVSTPGHKFWSPQFGWTSAINLRAGDILVLVNGEYVVVEKVQHEILESPVKVYNFEVEGTHTYFVGDSGVLTHNDCIRQEGKYHVYETVTLESEYQYKSDSVQFNRANKQLLDHLETDKAFRKDMFSRHPELADWVKNGNRSVSPSGFTWHHSEETGVLLLVDRSDHAMNHKIYHPTDLGGRAIWGGGKMGRLGWLDESGNILPKYTDRKGNLLPEYLEKLMKK